MQSGFGKIFFLFNLSFLISMSIPPLQHPSGYGTYPSATHQAAGHHCATSSLPRSAPGTLGWPRSGGANATSSSSSSSSSSQQIQQRISVPPNSSQGNLKNNLAARRKAAFLLSVVKRFRPHHNTQGFDISKQYNKYVLSFLCVTCVFPQPCLHC